MILKMKCLQAAIVIVISIVSLNAQAQLYFCEMTEFVIINAEGTDRYENQKFTMNVRPNAVSFKSDGYFENSRGVIDYWRGDDEWSATTTNDLRYVDSIYRFGDGVLNVSVVFVKQITSIRAECKRDQ